MNVLKQKYKRNSDTGKILLGQIPGVIIHLKDMQNNTEVCQDDQLVMQGAMTRGDFNLKWSPYYHPELTRPDLVEDV